MNSSLPELRRVVCLGSGEFGDNGVEIQTYSSFASGGQSVFMNDPRLRHAEKAVIPDDILNLQFTSGMTMFVDTMWEVDEQTR